MTYTDSKVTGDTLTAAEWNSMVINQNSSASGHSHSGTQYDGNGILDPITVNITDTSTNTYGLGVTRNITNAATHLVYIKEDHTLTTNTAVVIDSDGTGNILEVRDGGTVKMTVSDGGTVTFAGNVTIDGSLDANIEYTSTSLNISGIGTIATLLAATATITSLIATNCTISGTGTITTADVNGGNIDGTTIGASSSGAGTFSSIQVGNLIVGGTGTIATFDINGGNIDATVIGASTPAAITGALGSFSTLSCTGTVYGITTAYATNLNLVSVLSGQHGNMTGTVTLATADINSGNIDNTIIGASTPVAGSFTLVTSSTINCTTTIYGVTTLNCSTVSASNSLVATNTLKGGSLTDGTLTISSGDIDGADVISGASANLTGTSTFATLNATLLQNITTLSGFTFTKEECTGGHLTGTDGAVNRVWTLSNARLSKTELVFADGLLLASGANTTSDQYDPTHAAANSTLLFKTNIYDAQNLVAIYLM